MRVFTWDKPDDVMSEISEDISENVEEDNFVTVPGLSSYAPTGEGAGESLRRLMDTAKKLIPEVQWSSTPLFVLSTAGVRVLPAGDRKRILDDVYDVISGEEEAVFGFMSINAGSYTDPGDWAGVVDMGGASTQITFIPEGGSVLGNPATFFYDSVLHSVYANSFANMGQDVILVRYNDKVAAAASASTNASTSDQAIATVESNCYKPNFSFVHTAPDGTKVNIVGTGNGEACLPEIEELLHFEYECLLEPCAFMGRHVSPLAGNFVALSAYFYRANLIGLVEWTGSADLTPSQILTAAYDYCKVDIPDDYTIHERDGCFQAIYMARVLQSYGFGDDYPGTLTFTRSVDGRNADWSLGALLYQREVAYLLCKKECSDAAVDPAIETSTVNPHTATPFPETSCAATRIMPRILFLLLLLCVLAQL
jgi:apyrase